jgi:hypothetical protein|tara:strand:- start:3687 stop:3860 length:174 start_codon:yes stop_codon:yes gene_type:complete
MRVRIMKDKYKVYHDVGVLKATLELLILYKYVDKHGEDMIQRTLDNVQKDKQDGSTL